MGGPASSRGGSFNPPRGLNGGSPFESPRNNGWGGPLNGGSGGSLMSQGPPSMMGGGGMSMGGGNQGNGMSPSKSSTQVTIPKDVSFV